MVDVQTRVKEDFAPIANEIAGVLLFGSYAEGRAHAGSDVDVCIVSGPGKSPEEVLRLVWERAHLGRLPYDVRVFEELPLYLQGQVLETGIVLLASDVARLSEHLRRYRKIWEDQRARARMSEADAARLLEARRRAGSART